MFAFFLLLIAKVRGDVGGNKIRVRVNN
jgi:hypothetical protein